jgi:TatD DNase family protein
MLPFLDLHTHRQRQETELRQIISYSITAEQEAVWAQEATVSVGLHPWFARMDHLEADLARLTVLARLPEVKMIGECGLDRLRGEPLAMQLIIFRKQIVLAMEVDKPVIIHCVRCFEELMGLSKALNPAVPMIVHGFNKKEDLGLKLLNQGFRLSFGQAILKPDSGATKLLKDLNMFFLETDDGECSIQEIYQAAANLKKCTVEELKALIFANWKKIKLI